MAFHGLFIGVDRYASRHINWLSCAKSTMRFSSRARCELWNATPADEDAIRTRIEAEFQRPACGSRRDDSVTAHELAAIPTTETRDEIFEAMDADGRSPQPRSHRFSRVRVSRIRDRAKRSVAADHVAILVELIAIGIVRAASRAERMEFAG
jgi:hypothetical protein